jgi:hypothetical protein
VVIHPSYADSLSLQDAIIGSLDPNVSLRTSGVILELPDAIDVTAYTVQLQKLKEQLQSLPEGDKTAGEYEELVGSVIRLCFFKALTNLEPRVRSYSGRVIRDWIASNTAGGGFWHMVCQRYGATQVIWECKNYSNLDAAAFHQAAYYMTKEIGRFAIVCFRGQVKKGYYEHIKRVSSEKDGGVILLLGDRDIEVFLRQAINMKSREAHLRDIFDRTVREIS